MNNDLDTLNCNQLEDKFGFHGEEKSNFQLFGIGKLSAKQIAKRGKKDITQQITGCVKPKALGAGVGGLLLGGGIQQIALINKYKKEMKAYKNCLNNYKAKTQAEAQAIAEERAKSAEAIKKLDRVEEWRDQNKLSAENIAKMTDADKQEVIRMLGIDTQKTTVDDATDDKILGMPKTAFFIGLGVIALIGGVVVYKKFIAK